MGNTFPRPSILMTETTFCRFSVFYGVFRRIRRVSAAPLYYYVISEVCREILIDEEAPSLFLRIKNHF